MENQQLHIRIAEQGKIYALDGNYKEALRHYREAMMMVQKNKDSDIFFQHYSQCTMEALELSGAYEEVLSFCEKYLDFLEEKEETPLIRKHKAFVLQRKGIQHILMEEQDEAKESFQEAQNLMGRKNQPLSDECLNWLQRGYRITPDQLRKTQDKNQYFIVRKDQINHQLAMQLPEAVSPL